LRQNHRSEICDLILPVFLYVARMTIDSLISFRKDLHRYPEVSGNEHETAKRISAHLAKTSPDLLIESLGTTGIAALYKGKKPGKRLLIRCELDALPITEISTNEHQSQHHGVSHACGHDGHMTILCGLASILGRKRPEFGSVVLLFQPAEENGHGARDILNDPKFRDIKPDWVVALHNIPGVEMGQVIVKTGTFTPAVNSILIKLKGKTAHAGEPHNGLNPALAMADILQELMNWTVPDISDSNFCLVTPVYAHMGEKAYGVSAGEGEVHITIRSLTNDGMRALETKAEQTVRRIAKKHMLRVDISWTESFFANINHTRMVQWIAEAAVTEELELMSKSTPFGFGEDFGLFTDRFPGAMFGLGAGTRTPALHNPDYDFPDELIAIGIRVFSRLIRTIQHD
jgi:amidohydrolase